MTAEPQRVHVEGVTVVRRSRVQLWSIGVFLAAVFVALAVREFTGSPTASAIVAGIIVLALVCALIGGWIMMLVRPTRLEIGADTITFADIKGRQTRLTGQPGDELVITMTGGYRYRRLNLSVNGAGPVIPLNMYSEREVRRVCQARGWQFRAGTGRRRGWRKAAAG